MVSMPLEELHQSQPAPEPVALEEQELHESQPAVAVQEASLKVVWAWVRPGRVAVPVSAGSAEL